jgi:hypothetical protein
MAKVYFLKQFNSLESKTRDILNNFYQNGSKIIVKIHFGEPGNNYAFKPSDIEPIIKALKFLGLSPVLIDTPVAYNSIRNTVKGYEQAVKERGYGVLTDFLISDKYQEIKTKDFIAKVCEELIRAKNVLVISHIKGHACAGFGGAIKNLGMGGVSKETKALEHGLAKPQKVSSCQGCGLCTQICPAQALKMVDNQVEIDLNSCWGCSICQIHCPAKCLKPQKALFDDLLAQGAAAVINNLPKNTFYINIIKNITKLCDCEKNPGKIISPDIGILFSDNPVAIDKASIDLVNQINGYEIFRETSHKDPLLHVKFTQEYIKKKWDYEIISV